MEADGRAGAGGARDAGEFADGRPRRVGSRLDRPRGGVPGFGQRVLSRRVGEAGGGARVRRGARHPGQLAVAGT